MSGDIDETRRHLLAGSVGLATSLYAAGGIAATPGGGPTPVDEGTVADAKIAFPPIDASTERPGSPPPNPDGPGQPGFKGQRRDHQCHNVEPRTPGEEGLQDQILIAAIYQSAETGKPINLRR